MTVNLNTTPLAETEAIYDLLAQAIDQAGADKTELFLTKLALLQAQTLGDVAALQQLVAIALSDL